MAEIFNFLDKRSKTFIWLKMKNIYLVCCLFILFLSTKTFGNDVNDIAKSYVKLVLEIGLYDSEYADSYFGPADWKPSEGAAEEEFPAEQLTKQVNKLIEQLENAMTHDALGGHPDRYKFMKYQLESVKCKIEIMGGKEMRFDEESKGLYGIAAPAFDKNRYENILKNINEALPGEKSLNDRFTKYYEKFLVPRDKVRSILTEAIKKYRRQTLEHIKLPAEEKMEIETTGLESWAANLEFKGNSSSVMTLNTANPFYFWDIITIARHESYPGHHVYLTMLEKSLYKEKKWPEFSVLPTNSPLAFVAEGLAEYGCAELPGMKPENMSFEKDVLFPMAGFNPADAKKYFEIMALIDQLDGAEIEAARRYLDGDMDYMQAQELIKKYCLTSPAGIVSLMTFIQSNRSYIITYSFGKECVKKFIDKNTGDNLSPDKKWEIYNRLLTTPITPSDLFAEKK